MRPVHYITLAVALALIAVMYFAGDTTPPAKEGATMPMAGASGIHSTKPAEFDSIYTAALAQLPAHAKQEIDSIETAIESTGDNSGKVALYQTLARSWQEHHQLPVAAHYYAEAAKLENSEKSLNFAGQLFLNLMQEAPSESVRLWEAQQAVASLQKSLEINPDNDTTTLALAIGYIEGMGETMQGVQLLLGLVREQPDHIPANMLLGRLAVQSGQFEKAIERFETVLKQEPENTEALYFMAEAYKGAGNKQKAIELFEKTKRIVNNPEFSKEIDSYINTFK